MTLARFTPSLLDEDTLNALFVHRHDLLEDIIARTKRATQTNERSHRLLVGPRGAGKTHLISLAYHKLRHLQKDGLPFSISWLPEDPWTINSYSDLLRCVLEHIETPIADNYQGKLDRHMTDEELETAVMNEVDTYGPIVLLTENLDWILDNLQTAGQRRLRAFLENKRPFLVIATATRLTDYLLNQTDTFYGFFDTTQLPPFTASQAIEMLKAIAKFERDLPLENRLNDPTSQARLTAIEHLAGGQPRMWALFATGLKTSDLDELTKVLIERFDDLTPFYQEQLLRLSPQERLVVRTLADADRAITVNELATTIGVEQKSLAKTMSDLKNRGWVQLRTGLLVDRADRRLSFYELAEPLARLAFQLKDSRGKPIQLVLDFLLSWFEQDELSKINSSQPIVANYLQQALHLVKDSTFSLTGALVASPFIDPTTGMFAPRHQESANPALLTKLKELDDACAALDTGNPLSLLKQPSVISRLIEHKLQTLSIADIRFELFMLAAINDRTSWAERADSLLVNVADTDRASFLLVAILTADLKKPSMSLDLLLSITTEAITKDNNPLLPERVIRVASELIRVGAPEIAQPLLETISNKVPPELYLTFAHAKSAVAVRTGQLAKIPIIWESAVATLKSLPEEKHYDTLVALNHLAFSYQQVGRTHEAIEISKKILTDCERILGKDHPNTLTVRSNLASSYQQVGRTHEAIEIQEKVLADRERILGPDHPDTLTARGNLASSYQQAGRTTEAIEIQEKVLADCERILGKDHPNTLTVRSNLASSYQQLGRTHEAIEIEEKVLVDCERLLGPEYPYTLITRSNLASSYQQVGRIDKAIEIGEKVLADYERILGKDHPNTLTARDNLAFSYQQVGRTTEANKLLKRYSH